MAGHVGECQTVGRGHGVASGRQRPQRALVLWPDGRWPTMGCPAGPASHRSRLQVEDAISQTSQTLQLLIEHDPVSQRVDQLRLDARLSPCAQNDRHTHTLSPPVSLTHTRIRLDTFVNFLDLVEGPTFDFIFSIVSLFCLSLL